jgi:hypothetical protein
MLTILQTTDGTAEISKKNTYLTKLLQLWPCASGEKTSTTRSNSGTILTRGVNTAAGTATSSLIFIGRLIYTDMI